MRSQLKQTTSVDVRLLSLALCPPLPELPSKFNPRLPNPTRALSFYLRLWDFIDRDGNILRHGGQGPTGVGWVQRRADQCERHSKAGFGYNTARGSKIAVLRIPMIPMFFTWEKLTALPFFAWPTMHLDVSLLVFVLIFLPIDSLLVIYIDVRKHLQTTCTEVWGGHDDKKLKSWI